MLRMTEKIEDRTEMWFSGSGRKPWTVILASHFFSDGYPKLFDFKTQQAAENFLAGAIKLRLEYHSRLETSVRALAQELK
jgi:hypothetical protein